MKKIAILILIILLVSSSVLSISWVRTERTLISKCQDVDFKQVQIGVQGHGPNKGQPIMIQRATRGDIGQQALALGRVFGTDKSGRPFEFKDQCLSGKILQESTCSHAAGMYTGNYVEKYSVTCTNQCNPATKSNPHAWCS